MNEMQQAVELFHEIYEQPRQPYPSKRHLEDDEVNGLRYELIREELQEFAEATRQRDVVATADALGDLLYVVFGAAVTYGIDLEPVFAEIHRSNLSKLEEGEVLRRPDGKILKGCDYSPPELYPVITRQVVNGQRREADLRIEAA
jgi:predicted HAD superfamily Cof-like phosphohydrolase